MDWYSWSLKHEHSSDELAFLCRTQQNWNDKIIDSSKCDASL